jgi:branched-chain amino acid transport system substrate-binding protein
MQVAMLVPEAAKLKKKRWAIVYPNYEYGQSAVATFKKLLKQAQPDVEFVAEQAPPLGKIDAGAVVQALADAKPDAIFNVLFGRRPVQVRARGQHPRPVQGARGGQPADRRARVPRPAEGRGARRLDRHRLPVDQIKTPEHTTSSSTPTKRKFKDYPRLGSVVGYATVMSPPASRRRARPTPRRWSPR